MKPLREQKNIDEMRQRLYERGAEVEEAVRHELTDNQVDVSRDWNTNNQPDPNEIYKPKPKRHYRSFLLIGSFLIFVFVTGLSTLFMYYGGNQISNNNIQVLVEGPNAVGGGEKLSFDVTVANYNSVPIESATLIVKYPTGTRSTGDSSRNLYEERIPIIGGIDPGEARDVPVEVLVYGEENAEKKIEATVEYRVDGSNGMFYKEASPLAFRINSSPLVLRIDNVEKVASGQTVDLTITAVSNASTPLNDLLITASYPNGFVFEKSEPAPEYGQNVWRISELKPEESTVIKISGVVNGLTDESFRVNFSAGPAQANNQYIVGSALADGWADFVIERPFIDVEIGIDDDFSREVVLDEGKEALVAVNITNTLDETVYDMAVEIVPGGNALTENSINSGYGFYDSNTGTVRWEVANNNSFAQILPGDTRSLSFSVKPGENKKQASFDLVVNVYARRVAESSAVETLIGTIKAEAKYSSNVTVGGQASLVSGSAPPKVGEKNTYQITLVAEAGSNNVVNGIVETSLPLYVEWLDKYSAEGKVTYNSVSKTLEWEVGNILAGDRKQLNFEVGMLPSSSQVKTTPELIRRQNFRANDEFTGDLLQDSSGAVTTELSKELGYQQGNGQVVR